MTSRSAPSGSPGSRLLARKLAWLSPLAPEAEEALGRLEGRRRPVPRRTALVAQGQAYNHLSVLIEGSAIRFKLLPDGRRQIVNFVLPGDFVGLHGCLFDKAVYSVHTIEASAVSPIEASELAEFVHRMPALSCAIFWVAALDQTMLLERIVSLGRRTAYERIAYLFLELLERMEWIGLAEDGAFRLPVTQQLIADTLGLSPVHVNRTLRRLRADGFVTLVDHAVRIHDRDGLAAVAEFRPGTFGQVKAAATPWSLLGAGPAST